MRAATIVTLLVGVFAGATPRDGIELRAQTQSRVNADADRQMRLAEAEMVDVLQSLRKKASGHPDALARLERAQSAWVSYRARTSRRSGPRRHLWRRTALCIRCAYRWNGHV